MKTKQIDVNVRCWCVNVKIRESDVHVTFINVIVNITCSWFNKLYRQQIY